MPKFRQMSLASGVGDWPLQVLLALRGKIHYFPQIMGCYRVGNSTSWSGTSLSDTKRLFKHWNNMIAWYKELDNYTAGAYHHDVYHLITRLSLTIYSNKQYPRKELLYNIRQLNWGKTRLLYYMKLAAIDFPVLARIAHSLNLYYPSNN